jgi:hypothetical protein
LTDLTGDPAEIGRLRFEYRVERMLPVLGLAWLRKLAVGSSPQPREFRVTYSCMGARLDFVYDGIECIMCGSLHYDGAPIRSELAPVVAGTATFEDLLEPITF